MDQTLAAQCATVMNSLAAADAPHLNLGSDFVTYCFL